MFVMDAGIPSAVREDTVLRKKSEHVQPERLAVSLATLSRLLDAHRTSVRRWLKEAGIKPIAIGRGRNGAIRYHWLEVLEWLDGLHKSE